MAQDCRSAAADSTGAGRDARRVWGGGVCAGVGSRAGALGCGGNLRHGGEARTGKSRALFPADGGGNHGLRALSARLIGAGRSARIADSASVGATPEDHRVEKAVSFLSLSSLLSFKSAQGTKRTRPALPENLRRKLRQIPPPDRAPVYCASSGNFIRDLSRLAPYRWRPYVERQISGTDRRITSNV